MTESGSNGHREIRLVSIPREEIDRYWKTIKHGLEVSISESGNEFNILTIRNAILSGNYMAWIVLVGSEYGGVLLSEIIQTDNRTWLNIPFAYGVSKSDRKSSNKSLIEGSLKEMEKFAKSMKFDGIKFISARTGFLRVAPSLGYKERFVEFVKEFK